jgi:hypothetical protein
MAVFEIGETAEAIQRRWARKGTAYLHEGLDLDLRVSMYTGTASEITGLLSVRPVDQMVRWHNYRYRTWFADFAEGLGEPFLQRCLALASTPVAATIDRPSANRLFRGQEAFVGLIEPGDMHIDSFESFGRIGGLVLTKRNGEHLTVWEMPADTPSTQVTAATEG